MNGIKNTINVINVYDRKININEILFCTTKHALNRMNRLNAIENILKNDYIEHSFIVDSHHKNGEEIHCVSHRGIIFILNKDRFETNKNNFFITVLLARIGQIKRYYNIFGFKISSRTKNYCLLYERNKLNN